MQVFRRLAWLALAAVACAYAGCAKHHLPALRADSQSTDAGAPALPVPRAGQASMPDVPVAGRSPAPELPALDLRDCFAVDCPAVLPEADMSSGTEVSDCDPGERIPMEVSWKRVEPEVRDCPEVGACEIHQVTIAPTDDGRLWVLGRADDPDLRVSNPLGLWLALYDTDGRMLHEQMADLAGSGGDADLGYRLSMAADARGHLFMAVTDPIRGRFDSWLAEYGPDGELLAKRTIIPGTRIGPLLAVVGPGELVVGQLDGEGGIARIGSDGTVRWTQSRVGMPEIGELVGDASARVTIASPNGNDQIVEQYDEHGNRSWSQRFDRLDHSRLAADRQGGVVRAGLVGTLSPVDPMRIHAYRLDRSGSTLWRTEVPAESMIGAPVFDARGHVVFAASQRIRGSYRAIVHELNGDGTSCRTFEIDSAWLRSIDHVATSASGRGLFFHARTELTRGTELSFGRFAY